MFSIFEVEGLFGLPLNWIAAFTALMYMFFSSSVSPKFFSMFQKYVVMSIYYEFSSIFGKFNYPGSLLISCSLFVYIMANNVLGLFPYIFTASSHGVFTVSLALPLWLGYMIWSFVFNFESTMAHFLPLSTPAALMPLMVIIESVSAIIRPLTLSIRLAANMIAGHLLLSLLSGTMVNGALAMLLMSLIGLLSLLVLELAVAFIQGYVFSLLSTLYFNEAQTTKFF